MPTKCWATVTKLRTNLFEGRLPVGPIRELCGLESLALLMEGHLL